MDFLKLATQYHALGFNVIPVGGDKRPLSIPKGTQLPTDNPDCPIYIFEKTQPLPWGNGGMSFHHLRQSEHVLTALPWSKAKGIAAVCGEVSGYAACIDFDNLADATLPYQLLQHLNLSQQYEWLYRTGSGFQAWVRCPDFVVSRSNKLDRKAKISIKPIQVEETAKLSHIEIRWNGHYSVLPPSLHPSGKRYTFVIAGTLRPDIFPVLAPAIIPQTALLAGYDTVTIEEKKPPYLPPSPPPSKGKSEKKGEALTSDELKKKYLAAAIEGEVSELNSTPDGQGNAALYESAMKLGGFVKSGELSESEFYSALLGTGAATRRSESEARSTIASGLRNAQIRPIPDPKPTSSQSLQRKSNPTHLVTEASPPDEDKPASYPYIIQDNQIKEIKTIKIGDAFTVKLEPLADFAARIVQQIRDEQGILTYHLEGTTIHGKSFTLHLSAPDFADTSKRSVSLDAAAGANAGIVPGKERFLGYAIKKLSGEDTPEIRSFKRTGWADGRFLIPGRNFPDATITLPSDLPFKLSNKAQVEIALTALNALINSVGAQNSLPVLMAILGAPLAKLAGYQDERYTTLIYGRTGKFKTTFLQTALCIFGEGFARDKALLKWGDGATENAIEALASHAHDLPILVDNYKPNTGGGEKALVRVIHRMSEGGAKKRLNREAELRETPDIYAWLLMTGEDTSISDTAMIARQLWVNFDLQPANASDLLAQAQDQVKHLSAIGRIWLEFLESSEGHAIIQPLVDKLPTVQKDILKRLLEANPTISTNNPQRLARNIAYNRLVFAVICHHPVLGAIFKPYEQDYHESIRAIGNTMAHKAVESNPALVFLQGLRYALQSGKGILLENNVTSSIADIDESDARRMIGYQAPEGGAYLLPPQARRMVEDILGKEVLAASTSNALYKRLEELGYLASAAKDGHLAVKRIRGVPMRVLHLNKAALQPVEGELTDETGEA